MIGSIYYVYVDYYMKGKRQITYTRFAHTFIHPVAFGHFGLDDFLLVCWFGLFKNVVPNRVNCVMRRKYAMHKVMTLCVCVYHRVHINT